jgi:hypothetical protein
MKISKLIPNVSIEIPNINSAARQHRLDILILVVLAVAAASLRAIEIIGWIENRNIPKLKIMNY